MGPIVLLVYAALMILGGLMGHRAGSKVSLYAGVGSGVVLLGVWFVTRSQLGVGLWIGAVVTLLLCISFGMRLAKTGKLMPAGGLLAISVVALLLLAYSALQVGAG